MRRLLLAAALAALALGCEAFAPVDLHYVSSADGGTDAAAPHDGASGDAGPVVVTDGAVVGEGGFCGCDLNQGEGCCVPRGGGASSCTLTSDACTESGGIFIGCIAVNPTDDSECCWSNGAGAGSKLAYAGTCGARPVACKASSECNGGDCKIVSCGGVLVGACDVTPVCP